MAGSNPTHQCTWTHPDGAQLPHAWPAPILAWLNNHDHGSAQPSHPSRALRISGAPKFLSKSAGDIPNPRIPLLSPRPDRTTSRRWRWYRCSLLSSGLRDHSRHRNSSSHLQPLPVMGLVAPWDLFFQCCSDGGKASNPSTKLLGKRIVLLYHRSNSISPYD